MKHTVPPIPKAAMPVVRVLRRDLKRPRTLPKKYVHALRWPKGNEGFCPMGLHPLSVIPVPSTRSQFADGECDRNAVISFCCWWDSITPTRANARAAVYMIWPPKRVRKLVVIGTGKVGCRPRKD